MNGSDTVSSCINKDFEVKTLSVHFVFCLSLGHFLWTCLLPMAENVNEHTTHHVIALKRSHCPEIPRISFFLLMLNLLGRPGKSRTTGR